MAVPMYMCDFETTTDASDCRVWAACAVEVETGQVAHLSTDLDTFIAWVQSVGSCKLFFHNLAFDGEFIMPWLFDHGYEHISSSVKAIPEKCFQTLISDVGQFYKLTICFARKKRKVTKCEIFDSTKKLPFRVKQIAKDFGLSMAKGKIDYDLPRPVGYQLTDEEREYIEKDCMIVQQALQFQLGEGKRKMTIASDALTDYKERIGRRFEYWFPVLPKELDDDLRKAYKGGFTWLQPRYAGIMLHDGITLDVNSLYPSVMYYKPLPYGYPVYFEGKPEPSDYYPLYIVQFRCAFVLKPDHIPTVQIKNSFFSDTEYLTSSEIDGDLHEITMTMTSVDLDLFLDHYDIVGEITWLSGFMFKAQEGMFQEYIDHWSHIKATAPKNSAQRALAKLMLNSLYGKFASSTERLNKVPYMAPDGVVRYYTYHEPERDRKGNLLFDQHGKLVFQKDESGYLVEREPEIVDPVYTPMGAFITAWARDTTIRAAQAVYDRFIYADTDSLHLLGTELPDGLRIHGSDLGAWDHEATWTEAKFLRAKTYIETIDGKLKVTCAGMPDEVKETVTYEEFVPRAKFHGKLLPRRVKGGVILAAVDFTIQL